MTFDLEQMSLSELTIIDCGLRTMRVEVNRYCKLFRCSNCPVHNLCSFLYSNYDELMDKIDEKIEKEDE